MQSPATDHRAGSVRQTVAHRATISSGARCIIRLIKQKEVRNMYGAILGDIIGSPYEFDRGNKTKNFPLFSERSNYTDDTVMTLAVAEAFYDAMHIEDDRWLKNRNPKPYGSYGNGSAMRVSSVGWLYDDFNTVRRMAKLSAEVTHDHPEGIKGAEAVACAIFLARTGYTKEEIKEYTEALFEYDLDRTCDQIRPGYYHKESCQETVPEAIIAFLESNDFEDAIRNAVSLGGDCDTLACITGSIAEAFYGVPEELKRECLERLPADLEAILLRFESILNRKQK